MNRKLHSALVALMVTVIPAAALAQPAVLEPIPGTTVLPPERPAPLPKSQVAFRLEAIRAIDQGLLHGSRAALLAYESTALPENWTRHSIDRPSSRGGTQTVLITRLSERDRTIEVAIRGTASLDDALADLDAKAELDADLQIPLHAGFRSIAVAVRQFLAKTFPGAQFADYGYSLYGHSLGGAVASIVSMYLHQAGLTVDRVVTFGAPRFTTNEGARKYQVLNQRTYRVVRCDDVVPFLPPPNFFGWSTGGYEANGNLVLLLAPPYFDYSVGIDIERDFTHQLREDLANALGKQKLAYGHRMDHYGDLIASFGRDRFGATVDLKPVSYRLAQQDQLCPARLSAAR